MNLKLKIGLFLSLFSTTVWAQIVFDETSFDFGVVPEEALSVFHLFKFTNEGTTKLRITNIERDLWLSSHGNYTRSVDPGETGKITLYLDLKNKSGKIEQQAIVHNTSDSSEIKLTLRATVLPKKIIETFGKKPDFYLFENSFDFGTVAEKTAMIWHKFRIVNSGTSDLIIKPFKQNNFFVRGDTIKPGKTSNIVVGYKTENNVGAFNKKIPLRSNAGNINLFVKGKVEIRTEANFGKKPDIYFPKTTYDFGVIKEEDGNVTAVFEFINTGTTDLRITNVRSSCGCLVPLYSREPVVSGEKGVIKGLYHAYGRPGMISKTLTVYTNVAGENSEIHLYLRGETLPKGTSETQ